jgi:hypothetical protein
MATARAPPDSGAWNLPSSLGWVARLPTAPRWENPKRSATSRQIRKRPNPVRIITPYILGKSSSRPADLAPLGS